MTTEQQTTQEVDWTEMLTTALSVPGSTHGEYSRFYNYSFGNIVLLYAQGVEPQPVATYKRWQELGRQVVRGAKARAILRPITIRSKTETDDEGNPKTFTKFKMVNCIFPLSDTKGDELPPFEHPTWNEDEALRNLDIQRVPFRHFDGNAHGYSEGRNVAVSPVATHPTKTLLHEMAHIVGGHTSPERAPDYRRHRGLMEFEAEAPAYLVSKELGIDSEREDSSSRAYLQGWLRGVLLEDANVRTVFKTTDTILRAGRVAVGEAVT